MNTIMSKHVLLATCAAVAIGIASPAFAIESNKSFGLSPKPSTDPQSNDPQPKPSIADDQDAVADIIVTAQRRDEELSKTPVSVVVVSADTLAKANIKTEDDLRAVLPGVAIRSTSNSNQINYAIRGQSKDAFSGTRPGVLPYVNEVQIGGDGATTFYDLQSIQALAGPQGTLFGRSATGGAILLTTQKPTDTFGGYASGLVGNYNAYKFEGAINAPIVGDRLMARIAGFYQKRDGFQTNLQTGKDVGGLDRFGVRGSLTANVGIVHNDLVIDYFKSDSQNTQGVISGLQTAGALVPLDLLYGGTSTAAQRATGIAVFQAFTGVDAATATAAYDAYFAQPNHPNGGLAGYLAQQQAQGPYKVSTDVPNFYHAKNLIVTNGTTIDLGDNISIRNIFGYVKLRTSFAVDQDGTPYGINSSFDYHPDVTQTSEELQIQGSAFANRLKYVVGGYYSDEDQHTYGVASVFDILAPGGIPSVSDYNLLNKTYAAYAQGTYNFYEGISATLGLRYTSEKVGIVINPADPKTAFGGTPGYALQQSTTYNKLSWQIGLQDQVNHDLLVYVVSRRAYKSGGYNGSTQPLIGNGAVGGNNYSAEQVTDAELGAKLNGRIGGVSARLAASLYYTWGENAQRTSFTLAPAVAAVTLNVPKSHLYGAELQGSIQPARWLSLGGSFNYLHATLSGTTPGAMALPGCEGATINSNGTLQCFDQYADTPEKSGSIFADITHPVTSRLDLLLHGDVYVQSKVQTAPQSQDAAGTTIGSYALVNFRVGVQDDQAGWSLTANLKNAFDRVYYVGGIPSGLLDVVNYLIPGEPRTFTVEARIKF